ncbi:universal stress protein [Actinomadura scrupuli]|uniref:universal stress protein n=1 Tax=Actinomadura scrupuli TaxID=559629 RepID=UPI003D9845D5
MNRLNGSHVLVGFDGSAASERAVRWAAVEARLRRLPLTVCHAWHWPYSDSPSGPAALEVARKMGAHTLDRGVAIAREVAPGIDVRPRLAEGPASAILVYESGNATLALVGVRGQGGFEELAAGSAAVQLTSYAHCPIVVVRNAADRARPVVVGVDGSPSSETALAFAFEEAALHGQTVLAVHGCWEPEAIAAAEMGMIQDPDHLRVTGGARLERAVAPWREKYPHVEAETRLVMLTPRHALLEAATGAGLLVLGNRGLGGVAGMRLGSVSHAMLLQAPCSVAIVPATA